MADVLDLDVLAPEPVVVRLGGHDIDCTRIPIALTFRINDIIREMGRLDIANIETDESETNRALALNVKLCATYCGYQHADMTEEWFRDHADLGQLNALVTKIQEALGRAYKGVPEKN